MDTITDESVREHMPSPPPATEEALEAEGPSYHKRYERKKKEKAQVEQSERKAAMTFRKQKKSRYSTEVVKHAHSVQLKV